MQPDPKTAIENIRKMDRLTITPAIAATALGCDPQKIRVQAKNRPELLGFPVTCIGRWIKIPRVPFLRYLTGE